MTEPGDLEGRVRRLEELHHASHAQAGAQSWAIGLVHDQVKVLDAKVDEFRQEVNGRFDAIDGRFSAMDDRFDALEALLREALSRPKE